MENENVDIPTILSGIDIRVAHLIHGQENIDLYTAVDSVDDNPISQIRGRARLDRSKVSAVPVTDLAVNYKDFVDSYYGGGE